VTCTGELRNTLLEFEMGVRSSSSSSGSVRKITPVTARPQQQSMDETKQLPLQVISLLLCVIVANCAFIIMSLQ